tara:strand:+ start:10365 stop:10958 length:594 start_codon:yes stop_codon:yes gene_type:complete
MTTKEINITNGHNLKFYKLIDKEFLILIGINFIGFFIFLLFTFLVPQFIFFTMFMFFGTLFLAGGSLFYSCRKKLMKCYYLNKANDKNFYWVEVWQIKEDVEKNLDPSFLWDVHGKIIPVIDNTEAKPKPFEPHIQQISQYNPSSIDVARTLEQSASKRVLNVKEKGYKEPIKLLLLIGGMLGMGYLIIVLLESTGS